jgi:hypothetical protein
MTHFFYRLHRREDFLFIFLVIVFLSYVIAFTTNLSILDELVIYLDTLNRAFTVSSSKRMEFDTDPDPKQSYGSF